MNLNQQLESAFAEIFNECQHQWQRIPATPARHDEPACAGGLECARCGKWQPDDDDFLNPRRSNT